MELEQRQRADALDQYWNAVQQGPSPSRSAEIDDVAAAVISHLDQRENAPLEPAAKQRVRQHLVAELKTREADRHSRAGSQPAIAPGMPSTPARPVLTRARWAGVQLATALLVLLALGLSYVLLGPSRGSVSGPTPMPAVVAPATPTASPVGEGTPVLIDLPGGTFPDEIIGGLNQYTVQPGNTSHWDPKTVSTTCCTGPRLNLILEGTYTLRGTGPMQVRRADGDGAVGQWEEIPTGTEIVLNQGDALMSRMEDAFDAVNSGNTPVELLDGVLFGGEAGADPVPMERSGRPAWNYGDQDVFLTPQPVPPGPMTLRLRQLTLEAGGDLPLPPGVVVQLAVTLDPNATVTTNGPASQERFDIHNYQEEPVNLYVLTLEPTGGGNGTPTTSATPQT